MKELWRNRFNKIEDQEQEIYERRTKMLESLERSERDGPLFDDSVQIKFHGKLCIKLNYIYIFFYLVYVS